MWFLWLLVYQQASLRDLLLLCLHSILPPFLCKCWISNVDVGIQTLSINLNYYLFHFELLFIHLNISDYMKFDIFYLSPNVWVIVLGGVPSVFLLLLV